MCTLIKACSRHVIVYSNRGSYKRVKMACIPRLLLCVPLSMLSRKTKVIVKKPSISPVTRLKMLYCVEAWGTFTCSYEAIFLAGNECNQSSN